MKNKEKRIIVTMSIKDNSFDEISHPLFIKYGERVRAQFDVIRNEKYFIKPTRQCPKSVVFEKLQIREYLDKYEKVLFLDSDILINLSVAPDIFSLVKPGCVGALYEDIGNRKKNRKSLMFMLQDELGDVGWREGYINSGVMVFDRHHKRLFDHSIKNDQTISNVAMGDQDIINYNIKKHNYPVQNIGYKFNHMSMFSELGLNHLKSYIIHYAGRGFDPRFSRAEQMRRDLEIIRTKSRFMRNFMLPYPRLRVLGAGVLNQVRSWRT